MITEEDMPKAIQESSKIMKPGRAYKKTLQFFTNIHVDRWDILR